MSRFFKPSSDKKLSASIKNILGFKPGNIALYKLAFLHRSVGVEIIRGLKVNNERLEFLGDAILDAIVADYLFKTFPTQDEGFLTEMRSKIVSRTQLNKLAQKLGLDHLIQLDGTNGLYRSYKGDAFEALIGAIYVDKGYTFTRKILLDRIIKHYFDLDELVNQELNFKSRVIEWAQKERKQLQFNVVNEVGTGYKKQYVVEVVVDDIPLAKSQHYSIKGAEQLASEKAWAHISSTHID
ncbi:MAG: ribonuclease III [Bacteroidales bacterium]|nr:ribonuclease III [Bacteroidales bacterium]